MEIIVIGDGGSGSSLTRTVAQMSNLKCEVLGTEEFIEIKKEQQRRLELERELILESDGLKTFDEINHREKGKKLKPWQKDNFYQK